MIREKSLCFTVSIIKIVIIEKNKSDFTASSLLKIDPHFIISAILILVLSLETSLSNSLNSTRVTLCKQSLGVSPRISTISNLLLAIAQAVSNNSSVTFDSWLIDSILSKLNAMLVWTSIRRLSKYLSKSSQPAFDRRL